MTYTFKTKPYAHQLEAIRRSRGRAGYAFFMEMGTGKTKAAIDEMGMDHQDGIIDCVVILAPKGVYRNWVRELAVHMAVPYTVEFWQAGGGNKEKQRALERLCVDSPKLRILLMNIEALQQKGIASRYLKKFIDSGQCYMAVDESTTIKGHDAERTKNVVEAGIPCARRRIMTGSPTPNSPMDLFSQFEFLGPGMIGTRSYFNFRARYAVLKQKTFTSTNRETGKTREVRAQVVVGFRNIDELTESVQRHSYRVLKEECLDLPPKVYRMVDVELTDEQQNIYDQMKEDAFAEFAGGFSNSQSAITTLMRLQQIVCGHIRDADGVLHRIKTNRINDLMQELEGVSGACIIWSRFRPEIEDVVRSIRKEYGDESVAEYHGGNSNTREADAQRYLSSDRCRFMVSTQQSGGYGNTWLKGTNTFYMSNSFNLEHRLQSEDRPHRGGQTEKCTYTDMRAPNTIDNKLIRSLREKINIAETIMGDNPREWLL